MIKSTFGRKSDSRNLMVRNLATSVLLYESIITSEAKARIVSPVIDKLINIGQTKDSVTARRLLKAYLIDEKPVIKILDELVKRFGTRKSGFTRQIKLPPRLGDGSPRVMVQLTQSIRLEAAKEAVANKVSKQTVKNGDDHE